MRILFTRRITEFKGTRFVYSYFFMVSQQEISLLINQVVVLNTNLYNEPNNLTRGEDDPCGQLRWFEQTLQLAQSKEVKVRRSNSELLFISK